MTPDIIDPVSDHSRSTDPDRADVDAPPTDVVEPRRLARIAATAIVIVPFVTAVVRSLRNGWFPIGDNALLFVRARDVWTGNHPYLGSWTSASLSVGEDINNPGAIYDWLIGPFAHLLAPGPAAAIGVATVNAAMVCVISVASHRIGGWKFQRWALLLTALFAWTMGSELLIDMWQPNALLIAFLALLVLAVGIADGDNGLLPGAAAVSSLLLQTHISYAYIFVFLVLGVVACRFVSRGRIDHGSWRRPVAVSVAVIGLLTSPTIWEQLFGPGKGNLSRLAGNASGGDVALGLSNATRIIAELSVKPPLWSRFGYTTVVRGTRLTEGPDGVSLQLDGLIPTLLASLGVFGLAAVLVALTWMAHRNDRHVESSAGILATVLLIGSILALSRLTIGPVGFSPHHVRWAWPLIAFVHITLVSLVASATVRSVRAERVLGIVAVAAVALTSLANIPYLAQPSGPTSDIAVMPIMRRIRPQLSALDGHGPVLFDVSNVRVFEPYSSTMMMWMQERGIEFRVEEEGMVRQLGDARRADGTEPTTIFQLEGLDARTYVGEGCPVAAASALAVEDDLAVESAVDQAVDRLAVDTGRTRAAARDAVLRRDVAVFEPALQQRVDQWIDTAYVLFATGAACPRIR